MSIASYRRNVRLGVTGKTKPTCFPSALEKISPNHRLSPNTYKKYQRATRLWDTAKGQERRKINPGFKEIFAEIAWELGETDFDAIEFDRAESYREFSLIVRTFLRHDYRLTVDIDSERIPKGPCHSIGIIAVGEGLYKAQSTWIPASLYGAFTLRQVYEDLYIPKDPPSVRYPFNDANITALPPAP